MAQTRRGYFHPIPCWDWTRNRNFVLSKLPRDDLFMSFSGKTGDKSGLNLDMALINPAQFAGHPLGLQGPLTLKYRFKDYSERAGCPRRIGRMKMINANGLQEIRESRYAKSLGHYVVDACAVTGEWLGEPEATGEVVVESEWLAKKDTDDESYGTYDAELFEDDENGMPVPYLEARAITRRWVFTEDQQIEKKIEHARERVGAWKARREGNIDDPVAAAVYALDERYPGGWGIETFKACVEMIEEGVSPSLAADEA